MEARYIYSLYFMGIKDEGIALCCNLRIGITFHWVQEYLLAIDKKLYDTRESTNSLGDELGKGSHVRQVSSLSFSL